MTTILGIETSCDETAAAVVQSGCRILSNIVASQVDLHAAYGGVFPEVASRAHIESVSAVVTRALNHADTRVDQLDAIAVTQGPGLVGSLLVGINFAKGMALATGLPLLGINHLEGHVYSLWLDAAADAIAFPALILIVSGGHTELLLMPSHGVYQRLGGTIDDAAGEAFDKVGRLLGLPFPGGPAIERAAKTGDTDAYEFPRGGLYNASGQGLDFSFSGLKTAVMREVTVQPEARNRRRRGAEKRASLRADVHVNDAAAAFQDALTDQLARKTAAAAQRYAPRTILLAGGVAANKTLRQKLRHAMDAPLRFPPLSLCADNAAMIAAAGHFRYVTGMRSPLDFEARASWRLSEAVYAG